MRSQCTRDGAAGLLTLPVCRTDHSATVRFSERLRGPRGGGAALLGRTRQTTHTTKLAHANATVTSLATRPRRSPGGIVQKTERTADQNSTHVLFCLQLRAPARWL